MPIKNVTDKPTGFGAGFPRIGKIYKGGEKEPNRPGKDLDHFRIEFEPEFEPLRETWLELYGEKPCEFQPVVMARDTVDEAFESWLEEWNQSGALLRRCDGERVIRWYNDQTGVYIDDPKGIPCQCDPADRACKQTGRLNLYFPEFIEKTGVLGYFAFQTHSFYDIITIYNALTELERMRGSISGLPLVFGRSRRTVSVPNPKQTGKRMRVQKSLVYIRPTAQFTTQILLPEMATPKERPIALPPPVELVSTEQARDTFGSGGQRRVGANREPVAPKTNGYARFPISHMTIGYDEQMDEFIYTLVKADGSVIVTRDMEPFEEIGIEGVTIWSPGDVVSFEPPLIAVIQGDDLQGFEAFNGLVSVDTDNNPLMP
jgi:hypothetical protein